MGFANKGIGAALLCALLAIAGTGSASATDVTNVAYVQVLDGATSIPVGHAEFCKRHRDECGPNATMTIAAPLTEGLWSQLQAVNTSVNQAVVPVSDRQLYQVEEFWTYPNGYGDCEDYVLAKRRMLLDAGWPASTLLMSVVKQANGEGHAVLLVRTDRGDFVLDNQVGTIDLWSDTPYKFIKRQSQANAGKWVDMVDNRDIVTATAAIK